MNKTAATLPKYQVMMVMKGVGPSLGPQLIAESVMSYVFHIREH